MMNLVFEFHVVLNVHKTEGRHSSTPVRFRLKNFFQFLDFWFLSFCLIVGGVV
jgi:hypothetical protein